MKMGTGWRRAFCTRDPESTISDNKNNNNGSPNPSPRSCARLSFLSGGSSNPLTPRLHQSKSQPVSSPSLRCRTITEAASQITNDSPRFQSSKSSTPRSTKSPRVNSISNPTSPRSPLKLSLFKNSFKFRSSCGICLNSVKTGQGKAIYTAECAHAFHFPCIAAHVRNHATLVCPVCNATWKDVPLLAAHKNLSSSQEIPNAIPNHKIPTTENPSPVIRTKNVDQSQQTNHSESIRSYDDDEPLLLSPTSRINTIPEADENAEEEDDDNCEFQGFFVNAKPTSTPNKTYSDDIQTSDGVGDSRTVQVKLMPECAIVSVSRTHETYALVLKVKAPPPLRGGTSTLDPSRRAPIDLVTVLDVGGSMSSAKLHMLKRAMRLVISSLGPSDRLSIVAFSSISKRLLPLRRMTAQGQRLARRIVDRLVTGEGNSVSEALRKATTVLEDRRERNPVASVMLLSDGQDEKVKNQNQNQRKMYNHASSTRFAHIEIPVHAFGFGSKSGYSHEPGEDAFAKCVGGLLSVVVQDLRVQLGFQSDDPARAAEISAIYSCSGRPTLLSLGAVRLGDLYAEEERELLVEMRVPASALGYGSHHVMTVRCLYKDPASQEIVYGREQGLTVQLPQNQSQNIRSTGTRIERLRNLFITTRAIAESRRLLDHNSDFTSAHHLLASARALLIQSGSTSAEQYVRGLEAELAELHWRRQQEQVQVEAQQQQMMMQRRRGCENMVDENGEPLTPTSAWRAAEKLAKMAMVKKSLNKVSDLHGFENARF